MALHGSSAITVDGTAIAPASIAATGNITALGAACRFGPQTGNQTSTLYLDNGNLNSVIQGVDWVTGTPFNVGKITFVGASSSIWIDTQASVGSVALQNNGSDVVLAKSTGLESPMSILSTSATGGIGYKTGAGGTVTQATSKSTGVTLNKVCGQITMNNAALAAGAKVSFVVSDTSCAATDIPQVAVISGGTANAYRANVTAVAANSFTVTVENITAGSLSEAPVIGFFVNKAVTA